MEEANTGGMTNTSGTPRHTTDHSTVRHLWTGFRDDLRERREARAAHRALVHELGTYTTPSEVEDLLTAVREQEMPGSEQIRSILSRRLLAS
jgi:hypothetical protein